MTRARAPIAGRLTRRALLAGAPLLGAALASACHRSHAVDGPLEPYGLVPDPNGVLDLPPGFSYRVVQRAGEPMSDGFRVPDRPDGAYCVAGDADGELVLLRNHENRDGYGDLDPYTEERGVPAEAFDPASPGGVTRVVLDARSLEVKRSSLVLAGTSWNCASGPSPWGFLTCEETTSDGHGFVFLCPWHAESVQPPRPIEGYGRFRHEAAAVDPETAIAYLTEDQPDAGFYRFVPRDPQEPFEGTLQALVARGHARLDTGALAVGRRVDVEWIDVEEPNPATDAVRFAAQARGAARFQRTEGVCLAGDEVFLCATSGGAGGLGQVLRLDVRESTLDVIAESGARGRMSGPDNICVSPQGVLYIAEDGFGEQHVRRVTLDGEIVPFARNARSRSELTGLCFSPRGDVLFVSLQVDGLTLAIRGPFDDLDYALARAPRTAPHPGFALLARAASRRRTVG